MARTARLLRAAIVPLLGWLLLSVGAGVLIFLNSTTTTVLVGHETTVRPTTDGYATIELGPYLPGVRYPVDGTLGAHLVLGRTTARDYDELIERYALVATQPEGQIARVRDAVTDMAGDAALDGAIVGLVFPAIWFLVGSRRRRELVGRGWRRTGVVTVGLAVIAVTVLRPWETGPPRVGASEWQPVATVLPDGVPLPPEVEPLEIDADLLTAGTRSLIGSAIDTYNTSFDFYGRIVDAVPAIADQLRVPEDGETVALIVADRHDNVGMDRVARAIGDAGSAEILLNAGDDTSVGGSWEAFSLDSIDAAFRDWDTRLVALGNHDYGDFVPEYLERLGFTVLRGDTVDVEGMRVYGVPDPRSSGLGNWRAETDISFGDQRDLVTEDVCAADEDDERVGLVLVHDANLGSDALEQGCVDLVVGGHVHVQQGPDAIEGTDGRIGWKYTNGTTGGAAYALAVGSKLRREAQVTLLTFRDGRPVGLQPVSIRTTGEIVVADYVPLTYESTELGEDPTGGEDLDDEPGQPPVLVPEPSATE